MPCRSLAVVDEELIVSRERRVAAHVRYIDIQQAIAVDVDEHDSGRPEIRLRSERASVTSSNLKSPLLMYSRFRPSFRREVEVRQTVTVEISGRNTATVVVVEVIEDVQLRCGFSSLTKPIPVASGSSNSKRCSALDLQPEIARKTKGGNK